MIIPEIKIAIDGHSSTGKSSFAKLVAKKFGFLYLDSGAMYRGVTLFAIEHKFINQDNVINDEDLKEALNGLDLKFEKTDKGYETFIGDRCIEQEIRSLKISNYVSPIATLPYVRDFVDCTLRKMSENRSVVMDGRDIGTTVFPDAEIKVFMTADSEIRAERRYNELMAKGDNPNFKDVLKNIEERDYIDSHRKASPLRCAEDAFILDNSHMSMEEELAWIQGLIQGKLGILK